LPDDVTNSKGKDAASGGTGRASPDRSPPSQTPFDRFEEFARKVISVPEAEIDRRERDIGNTVKRGHPVLRRSR
jgi:hypothetical protein